MQLLVSNEQDKIEFNTSLQEVITKALKIALDFEKPQEEVEISLLIVDDSYIQKLNRQYRGIDAPTDVLSFALQEETENEPDYADPFDDNLLGDIVISLETARRQSLEYGHSLEREAAFLAVHGCLHLLGYDHETEEERTIMRQKEEHILNSAGLFR
ncbi:rRNA maturation RNase YbeY [Bacillota bacterium LX-D]|nr:rRNA maturation RNase YbeY [Bacillota bacterium LX-D]